MPRPKNDALSARGDIVFEKHRFWPLLWPLKTETKKGATRLSSFLFLIKKNRHSTKSLDLKTFIFFGVQNRFLSFVKKCQNCTLLYSACTLVYTYSLDLRTIDANAQHMYTAYKST